jgi:hypothetical protein
LGHGTCSYTPTYMNAVADGVMYLKHGICNIIFKTKHKLYIAPESAAPPTPHPQGKTLGARLLNRDGSVNIRASYRYVYICRSRRPCGQRHRYAVASLPGLRVWIALGHGCSSVVFVACRVGRGLCDGLFTRSAESYRVCVIMCDLQTSKIRRPMTDLGCWDRQKEIRIRIHTNSRVIHQMSPWYKGKDWLRNARCWYGLYLKTLFQCIQSPLNLQNIHL